MAQLYRILAFSPKPYAHPVPWIPCDWLLTIDLDALPQLYVQFWQRNWWTRAFGPGRDHRALGALSGAYFLRTERADVPDARLPYAYSCTYSNDGLPLACTTLLQLGIRARLVLFVERRNRACSFVVATSEPAAHVLAPFFADVQAVKPATLARVAGGKHVRPKRLVRFTLPALPGIAPAKPLALPLSVALAGEGVSIGTALSSLTGAPIGEARIPLDALNRHVLVAGTTGSGKTNTVMKLVAEAKPHVGGVLIFDVKKEHRTLHKTLGANVYGFTGRNLLTHNFLKPECAPEQWVKEFPSILSEVINPNSPAIASKDVVAEELDKLYQERGVYDGAPNYPHVGDLLDALRNRASSASREREWAASAIRVLRTLQIGSTKRAFCVREGLSIERFLNGVNVIETDGIGDATGAALLTSVLLQKIRHRLEKKSNAGKLRLLIVVEEAQHVLSRSQEATSVLTTTCREIRSFGAGLVFVTQMPSEFSKHALANVNGLIAHKLTYPQDQSVMANMLGLDGEGREVLEGLPVGQALVRTDGLSMVRVPRMERPTVRDDDLSQTIPNRIEVATSIPQREAVKKRLAGLTSFEVAVLQTIAEADAVTTSGISDHLKRSRKEVSGSLRKLLRRGLVAYKKAHRGAGRPPSIYFLLPYGQEAYRERFGRYPDRRAGAGVDHARLVEEVTQALGVVREADDRFDILYREDRALRAVEVETGANNDEQLRENLKKMLALQGEGRFVAADESSLYRLLQTAAAFSFDAARPIRVSASLAQDFIEEQKWTQYAFSEAVPDTT